MSLNINKSKWDLPYLYTVGIGILWFYSIWKSGIIMYVLDNQSGFSEAWVLKLRYLDLQ